MSHGDQCLGLIAEALQNFIPRCLNAIEEAINRRPEYVECGECVFWRGEATDSTIGNPSRPVKRRFCRRHAIDIGPAGTDGMCHSEWGCGEGVRKAMKE